MQQIEHVFLICISLLCISGALRVFIGMNVYLSFVQESVYMSSFEVLQVLNMQVLVLGHFLHPKSLDITKV